MKIQEFIRMKENEAIDYEKEESAVVLLLEHVLGLETQALYLKMNDEITNEEINKFNELWNKYLNENKPIQYLIGTSCFYGYDFIVTPDVLIPRYETEELVENILYRYDEHFDKKDVDVCDLATGSGCIAIALAKEEKHMHVVATDISKDAVSNAKEWANEEGLDIEIIQSDMMDMPYKNDSFDCILCRNVISHTDTEGIYAIINKIYNLLKDGGECFLTLGSKNASTFKDPKNIYVDKNTKIRMDEGPEKGVPHFYADMEIISDLFKNFSIEYISQVQDFKQKDDGNFRSFWHYFILIRKK